jgi:putative ABC transport system permease protein
LILASERKQEIAILKAIGSKRSEVMTMILAEAFCIAAIGGMIGYSIIRTQLLLIQVTQGSAGFVSVILNMLTEIAVVFGVSLSVSLLFAMIPAFMTARLSVMEVFRDV